MISGEEAVRRIKRVSEMRKLILTLKRNALEQWKRGELDVKPELDIRSDVEYWQNLADQRSRNMH
ncbi:hypothetical protein JXA32_10875 [Candidatus Sumerlaeota bacterium]|nr:hypothetical protein [Candidatus Sumerlaeota bacterium]